MSTARLLPVCPWFPETSPSDVGGDLKGSQTAPCSVIIDLSIGSYKLGETVDVTPMFIYKTKEQ